MSRRLGKVLWFSETKGFGFIERQDGVSVFFHHGALQRSGKSTIADGAEVEFEMANQSASPQAEFVSPVS